MDIRKQIALSIYEGIGGDINKPFDSVENIYDEIETVYKSQDYRQDVESLNTTIDANGTYIYDSRDVQGYKPVEINVNVDVDSYYNNGFIDGEMNQKSKLGSIEITKNGNYTNEDGYKEVNVNIEGGDLKPKIYNGFKFMCDGPNDYRYFKNLDFSQYDWSNVYDLSRFFKGFKSTNSRQGLRASDFNKFIRDFNGRILSMSNMFEESNVIEVPDLGMMTGDCMDMSQLFYSQYNLTDASNLSNWYTSNVIDMSSMFYDCQSLTNIPIFDTSFVEDMSNTFGGCRSITEIPDFDTSSVLYMDSMFYNCNSLTSIPNLSTKTVKGFANTFSGCNNLTDTSNLQNWDFMNAITFSYMFSYCSSITEIPPLQNTGLVHDIAYMFTNCHNLEAAPEMDWGSVEQIHRPFDYCYSLRSIPLYDTKNVYYMEGLGTSLNNLTDLGGFKDLGKHLEFSCYNFLNDTPNLTHESLMNVIDNLYDRRSAGYHDVDINFGYENLEKLSDEEKTIAINKGYNLI